MRGNPLGDTKRAVQFSAQVLSRWPGAAAYGEIGRIENDFAVIGQWGRWRKCAEMPNRFACAWHVRFATCRLALIGACTTQTEESGAQRDFMRRGVFMIS